MFDRFTESARKSMTLARQEAQNWNHDFIGTEHMLLGVLGADVDVAATLAEFRVSTASIREAVDAIVRRGAGAPVIGQIPFTPRAKLVLEMSIEEAQRLGHQFIAPGHLLLGFLLEREGIAAQVLDRHGVKLDRARKLIKPKLDALTNQPPTAASQHRPTLEFVGKEGEVIATRTWFFPTAFNRGDLVRIGTNALRIVDVEHVFPADEAAPQTIRLIVEPA
jgi:ATP-dependent Clp protease ATP-binding subunit ClpA